MVGKVVRLEVRQSSEVSRLSSGCKGFGEISRVFLLPLKDRACAQLPNGQMETQAPALEQLVQQLLARDARREQELEVLRQQLADAAAREEKREQQLAALSALNELGVLLATVSHPVSLQTQDISSLTQRINAANFELDDEDYLTSYLARDSLLNTSVTYALGPSTSFYSNNDNSSIAMSSVRLGRVAHWPTVYFWDIDEAAASELVCDALFESDVERMQRFVNAQAAQITSLRRLLRYAEEKGRGADETSLQVFFLAFLKEVVAALDPRLSATQARSHLSLSLLGPPTLRTVNGRTDLMVWDTAIGSDPLDGGLRFHTELKKPFDELYQKNSEPGKDQTIVETEAIFRMTGKPVGGALSDLFCLAACICFADPDPDGGDDGAGDCNLGPPSAHFFARRVTDETKFVERLLMLLCGPEALLSLLPPRGEWRTLPVGEGAGEECGEAGSERADGEGDAAGPHVQARASRSATARSLSGRGNVGETNKAAAASQLKSPECECCSPCEFPWDKETRRTGARRRRARGGTSINGSAGGRAWLH